MGINGGNLVDSAQDRNYWRALVNATLKLRVPQAMELVNASSYAEYIFLVKQSWAFFKQFLFNFRSALKCAEYNAILDKGVEDNT